MGLLACQSFHARNRPQAGRRNDIRATARASAQRARRYGACLVAVFLLWLSPGHAESLRFAYLSTELGRDGPGLLLRDLLSERADDVDAVLEALVAVNPDVVGLAGIDYDPQGHAIEALRSALLTRGLDMPHVHASAPNSGLRTVFDMNGDGRVGDPQDAQGFGRFPGAGGLALLSKYPIDRVQDFSGLLWQDAPSISPPVNPDGTPFPSAETFAAQRLAYKAHWQISVVGVSVIFLATAPPVFDGPEDQNGRRNADELALVSAQLSGWPDDTSTGPFVVMGTLNQDPAGDGEGRLAALTDLLSHAALQDPRQTHPEGADRSAVDGGRNARHIGDPRMDTADFDDEGQNAPGNLRVDYVLPDAALTLMDAGLHWPELGRRAIVWADVVPP